MPEDDKAPVAKLKPRVKVQDSIREPEPTEGIEVQVEREVGASIVVPQLTPNVELLAEIERLKRERDIAVDEAKSYRNDFTREEGVDYVIIVEKKPDKFTTKRIPVLYQTGMCDVCGKDFIMLRNLDRDELTREQSEKIERERAYHKRVEHPGQHPRIVKASDLPKENIGPLGLTLAEHLRMEKKKKDASGVKKYKAPAAK